MGSIIRVTRTLKASLSEDPSSDEAYVFKGGKEKEVEMSFYNDRHLNEQMYGCITLLGFFLFVHV